jgi:hypothetical protein
MTAGTGLVCVNVTLLMAVVVIRHRNETLICKTAATVVLIKSGRLVTLQHFLFRKLLFPN